MAFAFSLALVSTVYGFVTSEWSQATALALIALVFVVASLAIVQHDCRVEVARSLSNLQDTQDEIATRIARLESRVGAVPVPTLAATLPNVDGVEDSAKGDTTPGA